jgi:hypothetical protein
MFDWVRPEKKEVVYVTIAVNTNSDGKEEEESITKRQNSHYTAVVSFSHRIDSIENLHDCNVTSNTVLLCDHINKKRNNRTSTNRNKLNRWANYQQNTAIRNSRIRIHYLKKNLCIHHPSICQAKKLGADVNTKAKS